MIKQAPLGLFSFCTLFLLISCTPSNDKERPSPLRSDSTVINSSHVKIEYGSPSVRGRVIWGGLEPFDEIWRTGANEATRLTITKNMKINGTSLDSGKYALFTIPGKVSWVLILNENYELWGKYDYDSTLDVLRLNIIPEKNAKFSERLKFHFEDDSLKFQWEKVRFSLSLE